MASYVRCETSVSPAGMVWADKDTLAILRSDKIADKPVRTLSFVKADGTITKTVSLPEMAAENDADAGQLALSLDGRHMVVAFDKKTYFLDSAGALLMTWDGGDKELLACPAFTPDSKKVAFKVLTPGEKDGNGCATAVAFFSPAGQELHRVRLPVTRPPQTQPAETQPATMPAEPTSKPTAILELPPTLVIEPPRPSPQPAPAPATKPAPASAPAVKLNPDQEKALQELAPELP